MGSWLRVLSRLKKNHYDGVIDLQNSLRTRLWLGALSMPKAVYQLGRWRRFLLVYGRRKKHQATIPVPEKYIKSVNKWGVVSDREGLEFYVSSELKHWARKKLNPDKKQKKKPFICIAPGASKKTKIWPIDKYIKVANFFIREGKSIVIIGGKNDKALTQKLASQIKGPVMNLTAKLSLAESAAIIEASEVLLSNDTGMMHMAAAVEIPVVALFGPTTKDFGFFPYQAEAKVLERELACRPCSYHGTASCPEKHFKCMLNIDPNEVIDAVQSFFNK